MWPGSEAGQLDAPGERPILFGPYQVLARLAAGGMANVLLAREHRADGARLVTIKTMLPELAERKDVTGMFLDEIYVAERLLHPNCVRTYGSGCIGGTHFMSMEFVLGDTVASLVQKVKSFGGQLPVRVVAAIMARAAEALHYVHELKNISGEPLRLIHRDVSPQNVMVTYGGQVKILDFGVAAAKGKRQPTITGIIKGKLRYMSLEHLTGRVLDRRADVYSLGVVLFEALTTKRLIHAESQEQIIKILKEQPLPTPQDFRPDLPETLVWITSRALALHPQDRYSTMAEMAADLRAFVAEEPGDPEEELSAYMASLFGPRVTQRLDVAARIVAGEIDLPTIRSTFDARRMLTIDLHPPTVDLGMSLPPSIGGEEIATVDLDQEVSLHIPIESPVEWVPSQVVSMDSMQIRIDVEQEDTRGQLERVLPELSMLRSDPSESMQSDRSSDDLRLLELANLWLAPNVASDSVAFAPLGLVEPVKSEEVTLFEPTTDTANARPKKRASHLVIGLIIGVLLGGPLGGLICWMLLR